MLRCSECGLPEDPLSPFAKCEGCEFQAQITHRKHDHDAATRFYDRGVRLRNAMANLLCEATTKHIILHTFHLVDERSDVTDHAMSPANQIELHMTRVDEYIPEFREFMDEYIDLLT